MAFAMASIVLLLRMFLEVKCALDPSNWVSDTSGEYFYRLFPSPANFADSRIACQALSDTADLASVRQAGDLAIFNTLGADAGIVRTWVGLVWNTDHFEYINSARDPIPDFKPSEPNGYATEPCCPYIFNSGMFDVSCSYNAPGYMCEVPSSTWAVGDPHIMSVWGCKSEAPLNQTQAVLMYCNSGDYSEKPESLVIEYNADWGNHIHTVGINTAAEQMRYQWKYLKHPKTKTVCGNTFEFHRYHLGINVRSVQVKHLNFTGMMADNSCNI